MGSRTVEDGLRVDTSTHFEGDTAGEVSLDGSRDDIGGRTLRSDDHVDTHGTCQLGDTGDGQLHLLTGGHDQVAELIDHHDDIRQEPMPVVGIQLTGNELLVILLDIMGTGNLQQVVTRIHLLTERVQRTHHLRHVGDDRIGILVGHLGQEVVGDGLIETELHLLRVHKHDLQLCRVLLI